ncbi:hypothetical protein Glove_169g44 [Diversispora epigaea]|uniref:Uncharacterized protein n=1 Tax=Diversispora epigaea TaxID=1348612 RepID=A0A397ISF5_9GLOM|nr:hypothetical protein Glove_169g44 [Diversispora epigaea]
MPLYAVVSHIRPWKDVLEPEEASLIPNYDQVYASTYIEERLLSMHGFLLGLFCSAPVVLFVEHIKQISTFFPGEKIKEYFKSVYKNVLGDYNRQVVEGSHHNFAHRIKPPPYELGHTNNEVLALRDARLVNNFAMYPISHPSRKIDVVIGFDCSSNVTDHKNFDISQDKFCARRGFNRIMRDENNKYCEVLDYIPNGKTDDERLTPAQKQFVLCLLQYLPNDKVLGDYNRQVVEGSHHNFAHRIKPPPYELGHTNNEVLALRDARLVNNFAMYPISHPSRKIDVVIGFDCSSNVTDHKNFDISQDKFCARRGFNRIMRDENNKYCEVLDYIPNGKTDDERLTPAQKQFVLCLLQYLPNDKVDPTFEPATADFATLNKFSYSTENVDLLIKLAKQNWKEIVIDTWKKKKEARLNGTVFP